LGATLGLSDLTSARPRKPKRVSLMRGDLEYEDDEDDLEGGFELTDDNAV
jgi:hypothetical protein